MLPSLAAAAAALWWALSRDMWSKVYDMSHQASFVMG